MNDEGWGWLSVIDLYQGSVLDGTFRLYGTIIADLFDMDMTGMTVREGFSPDPSRTSFTRTDFDYLENTAAVPGVCLCWGDMYWQDRDHVSISILRMPLADDGVTADRILNAFYRIE